MWNNVGLSIFYGCKFLWYQDTLYVHSNSQFYYNREVHDTVNFIISNVAAMFQNYPADGGELLGEDLLGVAMEGVLEDSVHVVIHQRDSIGCGVDGMEREFCIEHALLWGALLAFFLLCLIAIGLNVVVLVNQPVRVAQDGTDQTVITSNHNVLDGWKTFDTATFGEQSIHQVVIFNLYHDTLYAHLNCQFYHKYKVHDIINFIFGNVVAMFQNCHIYAPPPLWEQANMVMVLGCTRHCGNTSFSIHDCTIGVALELMEGNYSVKTFLGLPWKEFSRMVYMQSYIEGMVEAAGWMAWNESFTLNTLYYYEYQNYESGVQQAKGCNGQVTE
ncbi:hypothetical protein ZIOFF_033472 [Zingiber officinale]|uniref:Pectinesterase catalytic domain-containing protein n=1 Tax=Zingiber officinale TaxID=94328 RepID=A0A8J5GQE9_ZINOF|nr:hypothetical protein ZIOFF_033472 [Zingiber officinale]